MMIFAKFEPATYHLPDPRRPLRRAPDQNRLSLAFQAIMRPILDGMRAGIIAGLLLTVWATIAIWSTADTASMPLFSASAFGLLGLPQLFYGLGVGAAVAIWFGVLKRLDMLPLRAALDDAETDRRIAAALVATPVGVAMVAGGTMAVHLMVTSNFARATFQAQGLALAAAGLTVVAMTATPLVYRSIEALLRSLPLGGDTPFWTWLVGGFYTVMTIGAVAAGYHYAQQLRVWSDTELKMGLVAVAAVPLLTLAMHHWRLDRKFWTYGVPAVGLAAAIGCIVGAPAWTTSTAELRTLTFRSAPLVSSVAGYIIEPASQDVDWEYAGLCDDDDDDCQPVDEEPIPVTDPDHPARSAVSQAHRSAERAQQNEFENIPDPPRNVVFVMIDTLRQDHMGYAGYERDTTPNIDELARDSVVFNDAYATSPHTPRTIPPTFFGRYASNLNWVLPDTNFPRLRPENTSMYEVKQDAGWQTISKTSHFYFRERRGLNQGFDVWNNDDHRDLEDSHDDIATPRIWEKLQPTLQDLGEQHRTDDDADPFSIFVHFFDPHASYNHHDEFSFDRGDTHHENLIADYDSEIAHADSYVGRIIDTLKEEELYDDTIFVITSDHGEAFNEHDYYFHGQTLYNTVLNVPLLIRVPGWFSMDIDGPVSVVDIPPTLLDLLGLNIPGEYDGQVLTDVLLGRDDVPDRPVFGELLPYTAFEEHHRAVINGDDKLIVDFTHGIEELYDVGDDPLEQNNLIDERPDDAADLREMLDEFMQ